MQETHITTHDCKATSHSPKYVGFGFKCATYRNMRQ